MKRIINLLLIIFCLNILFSCSTQKYYNQWVMTESDNYYYNDVGTKVKNSEYKIDGNTYYFDKNGKMVTGFQSVGGKKKYFDNNGKLLYGWQRINNNQYYFDKDNGNMQIGWFEEYGNWYYFNNEGVLQKNAWVDEKYYVDSNGKMITNGYYTIEGKSIWFESDGRADFNHKNLAIKQLQVLEKNMHGQFDYNQTNSYLVKFYLEYDQDDTWQSHIAKTLKVLSDRHYVEMTKVYLAGEVGVFRDKLPPTKFYDLTLYDDNGKKYDETSLYIVTLDGMAYRFLSDDFNVDLRENVNLTIKFTKAYY